MEKATFYYIKNRNNNATSNNTFKAIVLKGKRLQEYQKRHNTFEVANDKEYYVATENWDGKSAFVYGLGWIRTKNVIDVPMFDGSIESWNDYALKYGYDCMFYSLTNYVRDTMDCCALPMQREFRSFIMSNCGLHKYAKFVELYNKINQLQIEVLHKIEWMTQYYDFTKEYLFRPCYCIGGILPVEPYADVMADDEKLEKLYRTKRNRELSKEGKKAIEIVDILDDEIVNGVFPISTKERIEYFFGEECAKLYEQILEEFKIND